MLSLNQYCVAVLSMAAVAVGQGCPARVNDGRFLIGYIPNWSQYRTKKIVDGKEILDEDYKLTVENVNYCQLTHAIYSFATVQENDFHINDNATMSDPRYPNWVDPGGQLDDFRNGNDKWTTPPLSGVYSSDVPRNDSVIQAGEVVPFEWNDHTQWKDMKKAIADQGADTKMLLSIGGWTAGTKSFHQMAKDPLKRKRFIKSLLAISLKYGFQGVDLDWEYPGWITYEDTENPDAHKAPFHNVKHKDEPRNKRDDAAIDEDRDHFCHLITELRLMVDAMEANGLAGYTISAAVKANPQQNPALYDLACMKENLDWIGIMAYDYHGAWDADKADGKVTGGLVGGHTALTDGRLQDGQSTTKAWEYWSNVIPKNKLVVGLATYGKGFPVAEATPAVIADSKGKFATAAVNVSNSPPQYMHNLGTPQPLKYQAPYLDVANTHGGTYTWYEIKNYWDDRKEWYYDPDGYMWSVKDGMHYVAFDDECTLVHKAKWALDEKEALGVMIWEISYDDVKEGFPMTNFADKVAQNINTEVQCQRGSGDVTVNTKYLAIDSTTTTTTTTAVALTPAPTPAPPVSTTTTTTTTTTTSATTPTPALTQAPTSAPTTQAPNAAPTPAPSVPTTTTTTTTSATPTTSTTTTTTTSATTTSAPTPAPTTKSGSTALGISMGASAVLFLVSLFL